MLAFILAFIQFLFIGRDDLVSSCIHSVCVIGTWIGVIRVQYHWPDREEIFEDYFLFLLSNHFSRMLRFSALISKYLYNSALMAVLKNAFLSLTLDSASAVVIRIVSILFNTRFGLSQKARPTLSNYPLNEACCSFDSLSLLLLLILLPKITSPSLFFSLRLVEGWEVI